MADADRDDEDRLVERARAGDREAFGLLVHAHLPRVWRLAYRIVRHREDAEDVAQETFVTAFRSLPDFRGEARFTTWLHRIAVTRALNHVSRAEERERRAALAIGVTEHDDPEPRTVSDLPHPGPSPFRALQAREMASRLADCFERLPAEWKAVVALRDAESRAYVEMAHLLGIAIGTVRSRLARARFALRRCVEETL